MAGQSKMRGRAGVAAAGITVVAMMTGASAAAAATPGTMACGRGGLELAGTTTGGAAMTGAYSCKSAPYGSEVATAADALIAYVDRMLPAGAPRNGYMIESVATQVVAGMNYQFVLRAPGQHPETVVGTVYVPLRGNPIVSNAYALAGTGMSGSSRASAYSNSSSSAYSSTSGNSDTSGY